jgi:hypothetical protein
MPTIPLDSPELAARRASVELRDEFLKAGWPSAAALAPLFNCSVEDTQCLLTKLREAGKLLAVWSQPDETYVFPPFQFNDTGVRPEVESLLTALNAIPGLAPAFDRGGLARALWLYGRTASLSDAALGLGTSLAARAASDVFATSPQAVIGMARREATDKSNHAW